VHYLRFAHNTCPRYGQWLTGQLDGRPSCSPLIHMRHSCASSAKLVCRRRRLYTREHVSALSLTPCTGRRLSAEWRPRGRRRCFYVLILVDHQTNIYMQHTSAHSFTLHPVDNSLCFVTLFKYRLLIRIKITLDVIFKMHALNTRNLY